MLLKAAQIAKCFLRLQSCELPEKYLGYNTVFIISLKTFRIKYYSLSKSNILVHVPKVGSLLTNCNTRGQWGEGGLKRAFIRNNSLFVFPNLVLKS